MDFSTIKKKLKKELDKERYEHTKGVMYTACCLAMANEYNIDKAMLAGLLHDCAKCIPNDEKIKICNDNNILINDAELSNPGLLHAKVGSYIAETKYNITDPDILHAIKVHTTGCPEMNILDKILYIADYIEPKRDIAPRLDYIRKIAFEDLDTCIAEILYDSLHYLSGQNKSIDPMTQNTYEYYKQFRREEEMETLELVKKVASALEDKKAEDITVIDIREVSSIADYFIIANGNNANQLVAMQDAVDEAMYTNGVHSKQVEGNNNSTWILMDYQDIIVHLFSKEDRLFYDLERIWRDGKIVEL